VRAPESPLGIGCDVVDVARFAAALTRAGAGFAAELFTAGELAAAGDDSAELARLFAVKEAAMKAFGHGLVEGVTARQFEVVTITNGRHRVSADGRPAMHASSELDSGHAYARAWFRRVREGTCDSC